MTENRITVPKDIYTLKNLKVIVTKFELFSISYSQFMGVFLSQHLCSENFTDLDAFQINPYLNTSRIIQLTHLKNSLENFTFVYCSHTAMYEALEWALGV